MEDINGMRRLIFIILVCCAAFLAASAGWVWAAEPADLTLDPAAMNVNTFFSGGQLTVSGEIPAADDVVVEIIGPAANSLFNLKGRIGPFWMTRDKVELENAPGLYMLMMPAGQEWEHKAAGLGLGVDNLKQRISIGKSAEPTDRVFTMFVKLKKSEGLYGETPGAVTYATAENSAKRFTASAVLPSSTAVGVYQIKATVMEQGTVVRTLQHDFVVQEVGFVKMVNELASNRRLVFGVSAVLIALFAGAVMGFIFKGGGGH